MPRFVLSRRVRVALAIGATGGAASSCAGGEIDLVSSSATSASHTPGVASSSPAPPASSDPCAAPPVPSGAIPPPPKCAPAASGQAATFVIDRIFWGDTDEQGNPDTAHWWRYGVDLDGVAFPKPTTDGACKRLEGVAPSTDGPNGIDDSWAQSFLPVAVGIDSNFGREASAPVAAGTLSYAVRFDALPPGDASSTSAQLFVVTGPVDGSGVTIAPAFDGSPYPWSPIGDWVAEPSVPASTVRFANGWVSGGTWVSGELTDVPLILGPLQSPPGASPLGGGLTLRLVVHRALLVGALSPTGIEHGRIVGILSSAELEQQLHDAASTVSVSLCNQEHDEVGKQALQAADMLLDGSLDATRQCDGISFGIGFHAVRGELGAPAPSLPPQVKCPQ